jgi:hypothetical protein
MDVANIFESAYTSESSKSCHGGDNIERDGLVFSISSFLNERLVFCCSDRQLTVYSSLNLPGVTAITKLFAGSLPA